MAGMEVARRLFVARLPWTVCRDTLTAHFQQFGKVISSKVVFDAKTGRSKRFGFVFFEDSSSCEKALAEPNHILDGHKIAVQLMTATASKDPRGRRTEQDTQGEL